MMGDKSNGEQSPKDSDRSISGEKTGDLKGRAIEPESVQGGTLLPEGHDGIQGATSEVQSQASTRREKTKDDPNGIGVDDSQEQRGDQSDKKPDEEGNFAEDAKSYVAKYVPKVSSSIEQQAPYVWIEIMPQTLERVSNLYCSPNPQFQIQNPCPRIILITGRDGSGRGFSANGIALEIRDNSNGEIKGLHSLKIKDSFINKSLLQVLAFDEKIKRDSVLIIDELPSLTTSSKDFSVDNLLHIEAGLERAGSYAVICVTGGDDATLLPSHHAIQSLTIGYESQSEKIAIFEKILRKHVDFDADFGNSVQLLTQPERILVLQNAKQIVQNFSSVPQIEQYLRAISIRDRTGDEKESIGNRDQRFADPIDTTKNNNDILLQKLLAIANQIGRLRNTLAKNWFEQLTLNEKLFGMLVSLLRGMPSVYAQQIYQELVTKLKAESLPFYDHRTQGIHDLENRVQVEVRLGNSSYEFINQSFHLEIEEQIKNYKNLLVSVLARIKPLAIEQDLESCIALGRVLARLTQDNWNELRQILGIWISQIATELDGTQKVYFLRTVAFAIGEAYRSAGTRAIAEQSIRDLMVDHLKQWLDHGLSGSQPSKDYRCAVVVMMSIAECFSGLSKECFGRIPLDSPDASKLLGLLKRAVKWYFPWVFFEELAVVAKEHIPDYFVPYSEVFKYSIDRLIECSPELFVDYLKGYSSSSKNTEIDAQVADDENYSAEQGVPNILNLGDEQSDELIGKIVRVIGLVNLSANAKSRVFDDPSFAWVLDLATSIFSTEPVQYEIDSFNSEIGDINLESGLGSVDDYYPRAVYSVLQWMDHCDSAKSRMVCTNWFSDVIHRCTFPQRRKLTKYLKRHLNSVSPETKSFCDNLLIRMQVLDGQLVDPSDSTYGVVLIHGHASELNRLRGFARSVQHQIGYLCDMKFGFLGDTRLQDGVIASDKFSAFESVQSRPPLLMPILEQIDWSRIAYVAILCASVKGKQDEDGPIIDLADMRQVSSSMRDKLLVLVNRPKTKTMPPPSESRDGIPLYEVPFELVARSSNDQTTCEPSLATLKKIEYEILKRVRNDLLTRSSNQLAKDLDFSLTGNMREDVDRVLETISEVVTCIESIPESDGGINRYRRFSGLLQLLRSLSFNDCLSFLRQCIASDSETMRHELGKGALLFLIRSMKNGGKSEFKAALSVLKLWRDVWPHVQSCEQEAVELLSLAIILSGLAKDVDFALRSEYYSEIDEMLALIPPAWRQGLMEMICQFEKRDESLLDSLNRKVSESVQSSSSPIGVPTNDPIESKKSSCELRIKQAAAFRTEILLGRRRESTIRSDTQYVCILFDTDKQNRQTRLDLCVEYYDQLRKGLKNRGVVPIVFRLGSIEPVCAGAHCNRDLLAHHDLQSMAKVALPILDLFSDEQLQSIVILGRNLPYDIEELSSIKKANSLFVSDSERERSVAGIQCIGNAYAMRQGLAERARFLIENTIFMS